MHVLICYAVFTFYASQEMRYELEKKIKVVLIGKMYSYLKAIQSNL